MMSCLLFLFQVQVDQAKFVKDSSEFVGENIFFSVTVVKFLTLSCKLSFYIFRSWKRKYEEKNELACTWFKFNKHHFKFCTKKIAKTSCGGVENVTCAVVRAIENREELCIRCFNFFCSDNSVEKNPLEISDFWSNFQQTRRQCMLTIAI